MKLIIGLGNPEPEYSHTRHNVGKDFLNEYAKSLEVGEWKQNKYAASEVIELNGDVITKPSGFMNEVGGVVNNAMRFYDTPKESLLVIYDELDLCVGEYKLQYNKGSRIHNGIRSINNVLGTSEYWNLRIGVRNESIPMSVQKTGIDPADYVLGKFNLSDSEKIQNLYLKILIPQLNDFLSKKS